jgi:hypothetical protein
MPPKCGNILKNQYFLCMLEGHGYTLLVITINIVDNNNKHCKN